LSFGLSDNHGGSLCRIYGQIHDSAGNPVVGEFKINTFPSGDQRDITAAMNASEGFFVWTSFGQDRSVEGVYVRRYDAAGYPLIGP
jgi:hypothetical protein